MIVGRVFETKTNNKAVNCVLENWETKSHASPRMIQNQEDTKRDKALLIVNRYGPFSNFEKSNGFQNTIRIALNIISILNASYHNESDEVKRFIGHLLAKAEEQN